MAALWLPGRRAAPSLWERACPRWRRSCFRPARYRGQARSHKERGAGSGNDRCGRGVCRACIRRLVLTPSPAGGGLGWGRSGGLQAAVRWPPSQPSPSGGRSSPVPSVRSFPPQDLNHRHPGESRDPGARRARRLDSGFRRNDEIHVVSARKWNQRTRGPHPLCASGLARDQASVAARRLIAGKPAPTTLSETSR